MHAKGHVMPLVGEPLNRSAWLERWRKRKGLVHKDPYNRTKIKPKLDRLERKPFSFDFQVGPTLCETLEKCR